jgi:predicted dehydrogenase
MKQTAFTLLFIAGLLTTMAHAQESAPPLRLAIVGLVHGHVPGFIEGSLSRKDIQLVAVVEPERGLARQYAKRYHIDSTLFYTDLEEMLRKVKPEAAATFTSTFDHRMVVETCARYGVHVMMEKPLAVSMEHGRAMERAAAKGHIQVLVNYETTWYPSNHAAFTMIRTNGAIGDIRRIVVHDGHRGPKEIGCQPEFLKWLTDPVLNGGGALTDFGCYGADLMTWLMEGKRPVSVTAVTQHIKPNVYPNVDDEATIVLTYPKATGIIMASWNWPFDRKDMEIYGVAGQIVTVRRDSLKVRLEQKGEATIPAAPLAPPECDPLTYLSAVVRGTTTPGGLSSLNVNMIVTEILDAARLSAKTGKTVKLHH